MTDKGSNPEPQTFEGITSNDIGKRGEKNLQRKMGGVLTPGSGSGNTKGDLLHGFERMVEKKSTSGESITVRKKDLEKLVSYAFEAGKNPVFVIEFEAMKVGSSNQWAMIPLDDLVELLGRDDVS